MRHHGLKARLFIRRGALVLGTAAVLALLPLSVHADPIQDGALAPYRAGWFANNGPGGPLTCSETCKAKAPGTLAEYEATFVSVTKRAFVCRVAGPPKGNIRTGSTAASSTTAPPATRRGSISKAPTTSGTTASASTSKRVACQAHNGGGGTINDAALPRRPFLFLSCRRAGSCRAGGAVADLGLRPGAAAADPVSARDPDL